MENNLISKGLEIIKAAVIADNAEELQKALTLYKQGLDYFMTGSKYMKNEKSKLAVKEKIISYMDRAEEIKGIIAKGEGSKKKAVTTGVSSKGGGKSKAEGDEGDEDVDPETAKLQAALSAAIVSERPNVKWSDVAGLETAKELLKEAVILPVKFPQLFTGKREPWKGILLYGPPGTGKSYLAKAVATECGASCFLSVSSSDLVSKFQGESERLVKNLFELARMKKPSIIFIDEIDSLASARGDGENESTKRIKTEFLIQMQGVGKGNDGVLVLGATNTPWELDQAFRRRFEKRVYVTLPELPARAHMFKVHIGDTPHNLKDSDFRILGAKTEGYSGSDISACVRDALYEPIRTCQLATHFKKVVDPSGAQEFLWTPCNPKDEESDKTVKEMSLFDIPSELLKPLDLTMANFINAVNSTKPSVAQEDLLRQVEWTEKFGQDGAG